ncbi:MAG: hypothetical protein P8M78_13745 [Myxococcota bacterium]|nr:hypothetical protein [Myxococcota bacterium]
MDRTAWMVSIFLGLVLLVPNLAGADAYDVVVDVTGRPGRAACEAMQAALNPALEGRNVTRRVLIRGQLGTPSRPVDYTMFHNEGRAGAGGRAWPYGVCHAFWPIPDGRSEDAIVNGYPDPLQGRVVTEGAVSARSTASTVSFEERLCRQFSIDRKLAIVKSGTGAGQIRRVTGCDSETTASISPDWVTVPDASSHVAVVAHRIQSFGQVDLYVDYDLEVHYRNDEKQGPGEYGVFADMGLGCYFVGDYSPAGRGANCPMSIFDGLHRAGRITIHEYGRRDDGKDCVPTWIAADGLTNRPYSIIWQAYGQGVQRGSDSVRFDLVGQGDRDNIGIIASQTWSKDFEGWRVKKVGTGLWISGSLNDTIYDPYFTENEFGVVVGANTAWGSGFPRWKNCYTGFCAPFVKASVGFNIRGGVVEGNTCGNFVMFGGYSGEVDRTFIETAGRNSPGYAGHSVLVGAGVCDQKPGRSPRQGRDRKGQACADDRDCPGQCQVDGRSKRSYGFQWDASLVSNRGSSDWFAFVLGKGTRSEFLKQPDASVQNIRVMGSGFGGETGHPELKTSGSEGLYFFASPGASVRMDADDAIGTRAADHLPAYDYYVSMASRDLRRFIENPKAGRYPLGRFPRRATCTGGEVVVSGDKAGAVDWSIWIKPQPKRRPGKPYELIEGGRLTRSKAPDIFRADQISRPFVPLGAEAWLDISSVRGTPSDLTLEFRCWEDKG